MHVDEKTCRSLASFLVYTLKNFVWSGNEVFQSSFCLHLMGMIARHRLFLGVMWLTSDLMYNVMYGGWCSVAIYIIHVLSGDIYFCCGLTLLSYIIIITSEQELCHNHGLMANVVSIIKNIHLPGYPRLSLQVHDYTCSYFKKELWPYNYYLKSPQETNANTGLALCDLKNLSMII